MVFEDQNAYYEHRITHLLKLVYQTVINSNSENFEYFFYKYLRKKRAIEIDVTVTPKLEQR